MSRYYYSGIAFLVFACAVFAVHADEYVGTSLKILDPVIVPASGYSTSTDFSLWSTVAQVSIGTSSSSGFNVRSGFEYFPFVTTPVLSAVAFSSTQVDLSWTASQGFLGWEVSGYRIGHSTSAGGPYTYTQVGNVLTTSVSGLSENTKYYFVVTAQDAFGKTIATSSQVFAKTPSGGVGGKEGGGVSRQRGVEVFGYAAARGTVHILRDGNRVATVPVTNSGFFRIVLSDFSVGSYQLTMYSVDEEGIRSGLLSLPITITSESSLAQLSGVFLPPTIQFKSSDEYVSVEGNTVPGTSVGIVVLDRGEMVLMKTVTANALGAYNAIFPREFIEKEERVIKSIASFDGRQSPFGLAISFVDTDTSELRGDINKDGRINLIDFSVLAYWYKRSNPPKQMDLNGDGVVTLTDLSILTYWWTG